MSARADAQTAPTPWRFYGSDISDTRGMLSFGSGPQHLSQSTAPKLQVKWSYQTSGPVSATPTVEQGGLYVPDWYGWIYKINPDTGALIWRVLLKTYTGNSSTISRTTAAIGDAGEIVVGDTTAGASIVSINRTTGAKVWSTLVDSNPNAHITTSPVIYGGMVYVGVASSEEGITTAGYKPDFRGSIVALNENTGAIVWKFYTVPSGYTGGAVWGSSPVIFEKGKTVIMATGNNYSVPASVDSCIAAAGSSVSAQLACMDPTNYVDSILALDLTTGKLKWSRRLQGADTWNFNCYNSNGCGTPIGTDADFASSPNLMRDASYVGVPDDRGGVSQGYILGAGQKSGVYWSINPVNGGYLSSAIVGPSVQWGSALNLDSKTAAVFAIANGNGVKFNLTDINGVTQSWSAGGWGAVDLHTGKVLWQIPSIGKSLANPAVYGDTQGAVSFSNHLLFGGATSGVMAAIDADTGKVYWTFNAGLPVYGGPAIFNDTVYWGAGYGFNSPGSNPTLYAFAPK